jgi:Asp-tRNA(Asn)/Glu-tRNA(Gln) amidotransferase B subunit
MNSFAAMARAIDYEVQRQVAASTSGGEPVVQETRLWEEASQRTISMRKKEGLADYRYYPEPDLPPVAVPQALLDAVLRSMPELPAQVRAARHGSGRRAASTHAAPPVSLRRVDTRALRQPRASAAGQPCVHGVS